MVSLSDDKQADIIDAFNTISRYLDDILNINNVYVDNRVSQIYPSELNKKLKKSKKCLEFFVDILTLKIDIEKSN